MQRASTAITPTLRPRGLTELRSGRSPGPTSRRARPPRIAIVVACSHRKRVVAPNALRLGSISGVPELRRTEWRRRLESIAAEVHPVQDLYVGEHWRAAHDAYELALQFSRRAELWVISAGYGLIAGRKLVKSYSATFASGSRDSVWRGPHDGDRRISLREWWLALPHDTALPDLLDHDGTIIIVAGAPYVEALDPELRAALEDDASNERVSVLSGGSRANAALLPVDGRLRTAFGGTDAGLNARALAFLAATASEHRFRRSAMSAALERLAIASPATDRTRGRPLTDDHVVQQMRLIRRRSPGISRTQALRSLRHDGFACEQSRFATLWRRTPLE
jgi:hypothetical protein